MMILEKETDEIISDINNNDEYGSLENETKYNYAITKCHYWLVVLLIAAFYSLRNPKVKYYAAYVFYFFMIMLTCVVCTPIIMLRPKNPSSLILTYPFAYITSKILGIRWELRGAEILEKERACVMPVNHQSSFDVLAQCGIMNVVKKCVIVSRRELLYVLPYGIFMTLCGSIFIDRKNAKTATDSLLQTCTVLSKYKAKLLIYPEGKRHINAEVLNPFKKGAFRVAITGQFPIIPYVISPFYFIDQRKKSFRSGHCIIQVLKPISTEGLTMDDIDSLIDKTWKVMNDEYQKLRKEIQNLHGKEMVTANCDESKQL